MTFLGYSVETQKLRRSFDAVKAARREKIKYSVLFPAKLRIVDGETDILPPQERQLTVWNPCRHMDEEPPDRDHALSQALQMYLSPLGQSASDLFANPVRFGSRGLWNLLFSLWSLADAPACYGLTMGGPWGTPQKIWLPLLVVGGGPLKHCAPGIYQVNYRTCVQKKYLYFFTPATPDGNYKLQYLLTSSPDLPEGVDTMV